MECIKRKIVSWCVLLSICSLLYSCNEDKIFAENVLETGVPIEEVVSDGIKIEGGYLNFESVSAFESLLGSDNADKKISLLQKVKSSKTYVTLGDSFASQDLELSLNGRTSIDDEILEDEFLSSVMNQDGILKIGEHWFKIMYRDKIVLALHEDNQTAYNDLVKANIDNSAIMKFSTNDEVLTLLEEGSTGTMTNGRVQGLFCRESKAEGRNDPEEVYYGDDYRMVCNVDYFAVGVYFKLQAKVKNQIKNLGIWMAQNGNLRIESFADYKPRCRDWKTKQGNVYALDNKLKRVPHESTRALHKYEFNARFYNQISSEAVSGVLTIRYGM